MSKNQKWLHVIGICGKTTANVAKLFKDMGWFVTGSDIQFLPPASKIIEENEIPFVEGYSYEHLEIDFWNKQHEDKGFKPLALPEQSDERYPELVMFVESITPKNKEYLFAKNKGLKLLPYSQILGEYLAKENSIVVVGTAGKTTTTALITKILTDLGFEPSYMVGAEVKDFEDSLKNTESNWSVIEGDEFYNPNLTRGPKFLEYGAKYVVITNIGYEHQDVYPTQGDYVAAFKKLVDSIPEEGVVVAKAGDGNVDKVLVDAKCKIVRYASVGSRNGIDNKPNYFYLEHDYDVYNKKTNFWIYDYKGETLMNAYTNLIGEYNLENICAAAALIWSLPAKVIHAEILLHGTNVLEYMTRSVNDFKGAKKRLELLYSDEKIKVIDDFGVAPERAKNSLNTLDEYFDYAEIVAIFEPNAASRPGIEKIFKEMYKNVFSKAKKVIIPELSEFDKSLASSEEMVKWLKDLEIDAEFVASGDLENYLVDEVKSADTFDKKVIVFMSSYRLTEVAEKFVNKLQKKITNYKNKI